MRIDFRFAGKRNGFSQALNGCRDEEMPLSLTRLAAAGFSLMTNVFCPIASSNGWHFSIVAGGRRRR